MAVNGTKLHGGEGGESFEGKCVDTEAHDVFVFLFIALLLGTLIKHCTMLPWFRNVQDTVVIFLLGMTHSLAQEYLELYNWAGAVGSSHCIWMGIEPAVLLFALLPVLLTGDAMAIDTAVARQVAKQAVFLAGPGLLFCSFLTGGFLYGYLPYDWSFELCLTMGSILAATDPVAVVCLLKELGAPPNLTVLIQGESLLNDGTAIVLYRVAYDLLSGKVWSFDDIALFLLKVVVGAVVLGSIIGWICVFWLRWSCKRLEHESSLVQISITLLCAYWSYIAAEGFLGVSGVLATVCSSLVLADKMWPLLVQPEVMNTAWHIFEYMGNTTIFFLAGALSGHAMLNIPAQDYLHLVVIYIAVTIARGLMLLLSAPALRLLHGGSEPVPLRDIATMCWGGLRGAVGLSLAIQVSIDRAGKRISPLDGHRVLFYTGGIAALTLIVNATTCPALVKWLGVVGTSKTKLDVMLTMHRQLEHTAATHSNFKNLGEGQSELLSDLNNSVSLLVDDMVKDVECSIRKCAKAPGNEGKKPAAAKKMRGRSGSGDFADRSSATSLNSNAPLRSTEVVFRYTVVREAYSEIPKETLGLLRLPPPPVWDEMEDLEQLVADGVTTRAKMRVMNEAFFSLLRTQYWTLIREGEFVSDDRSMRLLLNSVGCGLDSAAHHLGDLAFVARRMLLGEDELAARVAHRGLSLLGRAGSGDHGAQAEVAAQQLHKNSMMRKQRYNLGIMLLVILNVIWISLEFVLLSEFVHSMGPLPIILVDAAFEALFVIEFAWRLRFAGWEYFQAVSNRFDLSLLLICILGTTVEFGLYLSDHASEVEWARMVRLIRVIRAVWALNMLWRCLVAIKVDPGRLCRFPGKVDNAASNASRVHYLTALVCFVQAHARCQRTFVEHLGCNGRVQSCEEARCLYESQVEIYVASVMAVGLAKLVDEASLEALFILKESNHAAGKMSKVVLEAHEAGILGVKEAEAMLEPMKEHITSIDRQLFRTVSGTLDKVRHRGRKGSLDRYSGGASELGHLPVLPPVKCPKTLEQDFIVTASERQPSFPGPKGPITPAKHKDERAASTPPTSERRSAWDSEVEDLRARMATPDGAPDGVLWGALEEDRPAAPGTPGGQPRLPTPPESLATSPRSVA